MRGQSPSRYPPLIQQQQQQQHQQHQQHQQPPGAVPLFGRVTNIPQTINVCDRTILHIRRSSAIQQQQQQQHNEHIRVVCSTKRQHFSRLVTVSDTCHTLPPLRKHVTIISFPPKMERSQIVNSMGSSDHIIQEQTYIQAPNFIQTQNYSNTNTNPIYTTRSSPNNNTAYVNVTQTLHKKGSLRNGDVLKRSRVQNTYELSQDILDKQIEVLERKYGGVKARNAALTIQRAFRRYTLLKKFAAITAMAKAEKRISRRLPVTNTTTTTTTTTATTTTSSSGQQTTIQISGGNGNGNNGGGSGSEATTPTATIIIDDNDQNDYVRTYENHDRILPVRSMSLRERRNIDNMPIPRSQSGTPTVCWENYSSSSSSSLQHYYSPSDLKGDCTQLMTTSPNSCSTPTNTNGYSRSRHSLNRTKVPPEVPKRTSSISSRSLDPRHQQQYHHHKSNGLIKTTENGSLSSVQSSGSDSSISTERIQNEFSGSPIWKRKGPNDYSEITSTPSSSSSLTTTTSSSTLLDTSLNNLSNTSTPTTITNEPLTTSSSQTTTSISYKTSETIRKRHYRVGLNLFNKKPERGISYLIRRGFLENSPQGVARFLISRKGLSKQMIGEYLGNLQNPFCMAVLECFANELDLSGMQVDVALRKFQQHFRMPGEAQKIERLMEIFSHRYCQCNVDIVARLRSPDTIFVLAFAIIMLNTDLHTPNIKPEKRMKLDDFIKNLRGIDDCGDIDSDMLTGIYDRVKANEFKPGSDHVTQVMKVQATIVGKKPNMALPHRRLVCYCRLYEIPDIYKKERPGVHQREVFLFNDLLVITKILSKKKSSVTYTFRNSFPLCGMVVSLFEVAHYPYGIRLSQRVDGKVLVTFNARNEHDRCKFAEDLKEAVSEMDEMENLRIEAELERQKSNRGNRTGTENRDSGVADVEVCPCQCPCNQNQTLGVNDCTEEIPHETQIKRSALSNSLLDIHEQFAGEKAQRRGSVGSLDSGMSVSFQSTSASTCSRSDKILLTTSNLLQPSTSQSSSLLATTLSTTTNNNNKLLKPLHHHHHHHQHHHHHNHNHNHNQHNQSFLGGLFNKKTNNVVNVKSTEV